MMHTKEPWAVYERPQSKSIYGEPPSSFVHCGPDKWDDTGFSIIARCFTRDGIVERHANAARIVAAVNACSGISNAALDAGVIAKLVEALEVTTQFAEGVIARAKLTDTNDIIGYARAALALIGQKP